MHLPDEHFSPGHGASLQKLLLRSPPLHCVPPYVPPHCLYRATVPVLAVLGVPALPHLPHVALQ